MKRISLANPFVYIFKKRLIEKTDPIEPIMIPKTKREAIMIGINNLGAIIERFCATKPLLTER